MAKAQANCVGLPPSIDEGCTHLILGSMPGEESLRQQQYYAFPQNRFWPLMARILENRETAPQSYEEKLSMLLAHHIALWDTIGRCRREGSLDTAIHDVVSNDFTAFLRQYPKIHTICFNGAKSVQTFRRFHKPLLAREDIRFFPLPSTSPANARWRMEMLVTPWAKALA